MANSQPHRFSHTAALLAAVFAVASLCIGCHSQPALDIRPLDAAGMNYDAVKQLLALNLTAAEVSEVATARQSGFSDAACVQVFRVYRDRKQPFDVGASISGLMNAGVGENLVITLAQINQLGIGAGELQAMRLAGLSDNILLAVAQHHAANQPVLSGASLASLRNLGVRSDTLLALAQRGVPDSQAPAIIALRKRGAKDDAILRQFPGS